jgi:hypothetical protein
MEYPRSNQGKGHAQVEEHAGRGCQDQRRANCWLSQDVSHPFTRLTGLAWTVRDLLGGPEVPENEQRGNKGGGVEEEASGDSAENE